MLMPLLDSQAPVFLFNDDWRAGKAILRARDFNKDTGVDGMGIILPYLFICLVLSNNLLCPLLRIRAFMHLFLFPQNNKKMKQKCIFYSIKKGLEAALGVFRSPFSCTITQCSVHYGCVMLLLMVCEVSLFLNGLFCHPKQH